MSDANIEALVNIFFSFTSKPRQIDRIQHGEDYVTVLPGRFRIIVNDDLLVFEEEVKRDTRPIEQSVHFSSCETNLF